MRSCVPEVPRAALQDAESVASPGAPGRRPRFAGSSRPPPRDAAPAAPVTERGVRFDAGGAFFRPQAVHARDLAVLCAALQRRAAGPDGALRALDVMSGAGIRAARYLAHAGATFVHANDIAPDSPAAANLAAQGCADGAWRVTREESCRLLMRLALAGDTFDVVDVDGFGSKGVPPSLALGAVKFGGLLIVNSTDWALGARTGSSGASLASAYGALVHACPATPEQGLRVLIGAVAREAAQRGLRVRPMLSLYAPGPAWRATLRVFRGGAAATIAQLGFNAHCAACGAAWPVRWAQLGGATCACGGAPTLSGPLWHGPLHDAAEVRAIAALAAELGWSDAPPFAPGTPAAAAAPRRSLGALLALLQEEADAEAAMPPGYLRLDDVARAARLPQMPSRDVLVAALRARGHAACRTHCDDRALKTDAAWPQVLEAAAAAAAAAKDEQAEAVAAAAAAAADACHRAASADSASV